MLQDRREFNQDTWFSFVDLGKAYDSIQHDIIKFSLTKIGTPQYIVNLIMKLYTDFSVKLSIGKEEKEIKYGCGVRQGYNLAGTIFIITMQHVCANISEIFYK